MKVKRRLKRRVQRLEREKRDLLHELSARSDYTTQAEADMAAMRQRHHAFMANYRAQQPKGAA